MRWLVQLHPRLRTLPLLAILAAAYPATANLAAIIAILAAANPATAGLPLLANLAAVSPAMADVPAVLATTANLANVFFIFLFALLQLLRRSAADIVREDTDREMATFLMDPLAPPDLCA